MTLCVDGIKCLNIWKKGVWLWLGLNYWMYSKYSKFEILWGITTLWFLPPQKKDFPGFYEYTYMKYCGKVYNSLEEGHDRPTTLSLDSCIHGLYKTTKIHLLVEALKTPCYVSSYLCQQLILFWTSHLVFMEVHLSLFLLLLLNLFTIPKHNIIFNSTMLILHLSTTLTWNWYLENNFSL